MHTSAGIGLHFVEGLKKSLAHAAAVEGAVRALAGAAAVIALTAACAFVFAALDAEDHAKCDEARERDGYGRRAALKAMESPESQDRFLYRVSPAEAGYRVVVVAKAGAYAGDAWERDALGSVRHISDACAP